MKEYKCGCKIGGVSHSICRKHKHIERWIKYWYRKGKESGWTAYVDKFEAWCIKRDLLYGEEVKHEFP